MDWDLAVGDELVPGRFIQQMLGGGERYQAFLTWNEEMLCPTVVKVLRPDLVDEPHARRAIEREGAILEGIDHPYFLRILGRDTDGPRPYLEIEFLDGPRLSTLIHRHGILGPEQLLPLGRQLAAAVHHLHGRGLLHLDVKPRNIIMGPVPRLIDLSVARRTDEVAALRSPVGTDAYMAPEQCDRDRLSTIGTPADVWGIGATMYEAASKSLPFPKGRRGGSDLERWPQLEGEARALPGKVPADVAEVILGCLRRDPAGRPTPYELFARFDELAATHGRRRRRLARPA